MPYRGMQLEERRLGAVVEGQQRNAPSSFRPVIGHADHDPLGAADGQPRDDERQLHRFPPASAFLSPGNVLKLTITRKPQEKQYTQAVDSAIPATPR